METENIIRADELSELSTFLDLARVRGLLMREMIGDRETLLLSLNGILDAIEECAAIVQAIRFVPIAPGTRTEPRP